MSANPRKFSEKIALQQQKQAEGTAAYEQIMREVTATTRLAVVKPMQPKQDASAEYQNNPNGLVIKDSDSGNSINLKNALMNLEDIKHSIEKPLTSYAPNHMSVMSHSREQSPMRQFHPQQHSKRKKFSAERHREFSPYASPHLLALDPGWRRVCSDSAIHAGVQSGGDYGLKGSASGKEAKNMEGTANQATALFVDRHLRPRSCEMAGLNMNGFSMVPQQVAYNNNSNNTLGIPSQNNNNSSSLPNIKSSAQQAANHSMADYLENARCSQQMASQPFAYLPMTVRSMAGSNSLVVQPGGGTIYLGNMHPQGSYMESLYGGSQVAPQVGSMPTQNGHFMLQHLPNQVLPSSNLSTNQVIGYQEVAPPPYPYPKSSSLPPTSPPPSITLTDVESPGRPLETILMESPSIAENMYSPSWDRFLQSPGLKVTSPNLLYTNSQHQVRAPEQSRAVYSSPNSVYLMADGGSSSGLQLVRSDASFPAQMAMNTANGNQWTGNIGIINNNNNIINSNNNNIINSDNINNNNNIINNNNLKPQNIANTCNNTILESSFRDPSVQILIKNEPPPPYESLASQGTMADPTKNSGQTFDENLFSASKRNTLQRQDAEVSLPSDLEDFPSLTCLGDSFEDVELMNAGDLLEPLDIDDLNLLSSATCTVPNEEFFSLDKNC